MNKPNTIRKAYKVYIIAAAAALLMLLFAACGGTTEDGGHASPSAVVAAETDAVKTDDASATATPDSGAPATSLSSQPADATPGSNTVAPKTTDAPQATGATPGSNTGAPQATDAPTGQSDPTGHEGHNVPTENVGPTGGATADSTALPATPTPPEQTDDLYIELPTTVPTASEPAEAYVGLAGMTFDQVPYAKSEADLKKVDSILNELIAADASDLDKVRAVHDWMVRNCAYDTTKKARHADKLLAGGSALSQGYAELFSIFMTECGIPCQYISGRVSGEQRAWNAVQLDGVWYYVDVSLDDPLLGGSSDFPDGVNMRYQYFLVSRDTLGSDHSAETELPAPDAASDELNRTEAKALKARLIEYIRGLIDSGSVTNAYYAAGWTPLYTALDGICAQIGEYARQNYKSLSFTIYLSDKSIDTRTLGTELSPELTAAAQAAYGHDAKVKLKLLEAEYFTVITVTVNAE